MPGFAARLAPGPEIRERVPSKMPTRGEEAHFEVCGNAAVVVLLPRRRYVLVSGAVVEQREIRPPSPAHIVTRINTRSVTTRAAQAFINALRCMRVDGQFGIHGSAGTIPCPRIDLSAHVRRRTASRTFPDPNHAPSPAPGETRALPGRRRRPPWVESWRWCCLGASPLGGASVRQQLSTCPSREGGLASDGLAGQCDAPTGDLPGKTVDCQFNSARTVHVRSRSHAACPLDIRPGGLLQCGRNRSASRCQGDLDRVHAACVQRRNSICMCRDCFPAPTRVRPSHVLARTPSRAPTRHAASPTGHCSPPCCRTRQCTIPARVPPAAIARRV